ncbi:DUF4917 family protein [Leptothoe sp. LEGE 181152]|nr:DUF4917 family protein [Leptothoe sp. LEGE 181152]
MKLETFNDVLQSIKKNNKGKKERKFHLLLGNGFSMAYNYEIFSYNALYKFIESLNDQELSTILNVIKTKNFEVIMQQLDSFSALIQAFDKNSELKSKIDSASTKLKAKLLDAVKALHPEHVFTIPEEKSKACSEFLKIFLDTNGKLFSTNYDLLLYWVLMRNDIVEHVDGFGRENENPDAPDPEWSELRWGKYRENQNTFYVHGALPLFDTGIDVVKEVYTQQNYLLQNISDRMEKGEYPIFVTAGNGDEKLAHIMHNHYLSYCYDNLCTIDGSLVSFGFNFGPYDEHIIDAINRAAKHGKKAPKKLRSVYIGVYSDDDIKHIAQIENKFKCKVRIFDAKSINVWGD